MKRIALLFSFTLLVAISCQADEKQCATVSPTSVTLPPGGGYSSNITVTSVVPTGANNCGIYAPAAFALSGPTKCTNACVAYVEVVSTTEAGPPDFTWTFVSQIYVPPNSSCLTNTFVFSAAGNPVTAIQPPAPDCPRLCTAITLSRPVVSYSQAAPAWGSDTYDNANCSLLPGSRCRMQGAGCAVTALAMALNSAGIYINPGQLNQFAIPHFDFSAADPATGRGGGINWATVTRDLAADPSYNPTQKQIQFVQSASSVSADYLSSLLSQGFPVIVGDHIQPDGSTGHFVLVTGKTCNPDGSPNFSILDPGDSSNTGLSPQFQGLTVRGYVTDPLDLSQLSISVDEPVQLTLLDPLGLTTGWNPTTQSVVQNSPNAFYRLDRLIDPASDSPLTTTGRFLDVYQPTVGNYTLTMTGIESGTYTVGLKSFATDGSPQFAGTYTGIAVPNSTGILRIQLSTTPNSTTSFSIVASFVSTLADITNALQLGFIDNAGIANALSVKIDAASSAAAKGDNTTASNVLNAFVNQVNAQAGTHITGVAQQVLQGDVASLISQLQ